MYPSNHRSRLSAAVLLIASGLCLSSGCATLAHRNSYSYHHKEAVVSCEDKSEVCPWLVGDALLLIPGVVPGVVAFAVDFGTGAWQHDTHLGTADESGEAALASVSERRR